MQTYKPGDFVVVTDALYSPFVKGQVVEVEAYDPQALNPFIIKGAPQSGFTRRPGWAASRFRPVTQADLPDIKVGDRVRIVRKVASEPGWRNSWVPRMSDFIGTKTHVEDVTVNGVRLSSGSGYWFPRLALEVIPSAEAKPSPGTPAAPATPLAPDGNPKTRFGMAKPPLSLIPGSARVHLAAAFRDGAAKYGPANWRVDPVTGSTYLNACERHLVAWQDGEDVAEDSGVHHLAHAAACLLIILDAETSGTLNDDRPPAGKTSALIKALTKPLT